MIIKEKEEIEILREGGKRLAEIIEKLGSLLKPGLPIKEIDEEAKRLIEEEGDKAAFFKYQPEGASRPYPSHVCVSINDEIVHGIPSESTYALKEGDLVSLDCGLVHKGLITDTATTLCVGESSEEIENLMEANKKALEAGINASRIGNTVGDIGHAISKSVEGTNFSVVTELGGHGVGKTVHENPFIPNSGKRGVGEKLQEGQVIAIEPMLTMGSGDIKLAPDGYTFKTKDGSLSVHFEHTVAITKDGPVVLTII